MYILTLAITALLCLSASAVTISCRNEKNVAVDWYVNYKLPKLEEYPKDTPIGQGTAYTYMLSNSKKWILSNIPVTSDSSMLANTLASFYQLKQDLTYLLYNDEAAGDHTGTSVGHTKGVVVFDNDSGFWLVHSVPKFPTEDSYSYPSSGMENGQSVLCITFPISELNEIGKQLLFNHPNIYAKRVTQATSDGLDEDVRSLFTSKPKFIKKAPFTRTTQLTSLKGMKFTSFAKDNQFNKDLYSALIAPELKSSLFVETWRRGSGNKSEPECQNEYQVLDTTRIKLDATSNRKNVNIEFSSTEDHSKWAISQTPRWVCIGDINRMDSQKKRGGGSVCFSSASIWNVYSSSVKETDNCNIKRK